MNLNFLTKWLKAFLQNPQKYIKIAVQIVNIYKEIANSGVIKPSVIPADADFVLKDKAKVALRETLSDVGLPWKDQGFIKSQVEIYNTPVADRTGYYKSIAGGIYSKLSGEKDIEKAIEVVQTYYKETKASA